MKPTLRTTALQALQIPSPEEKSQYILAYYQACGFAHQPSGAKQCIVLPENEILPGRPQTPRLLEPTQVPKRSFGTPQGHAAMIHALTHIEFNAINLALDAVWRFENMPSEYYHNWWQVAYEEVIHFNLMREHLQTLGYCYGDFDAHGGLWSLVEKTSDNLCARMALIPRTMEARGLDVTPRMQKKLQQAKDLHGASILDIILRDEVGHVAFGNYWFNWLCQQEGLDPYTHYQALLKQYNAPSIKPPFNKAARVKAGFSEAELEKLTAV